jgi:tetratricopeptide (TPR) repeat protein
LRKRYAVAGIVVAILVAGLIVLVGSRSPGRTAAATTEASAATLPASVPSPTASPSDTDYAAMVKLLSARYTRHPSSTRNAMALADAYLMTEQPLKAEALYGKVLAADPGNQTAEAQLAMALHASGRDDQALRLLTSVLAANPRSQLAHYNLAILYFSQQRAALARDQWRKAAAIDPSSGIGRTARSFVDLMDDGGSGSHSGSGGS